MKPNEDGGDIEEQEEEFYSDSEETTEKPSVFYEINIEEKDDESASISATNPDHDTLSVENNESSNNDSSSEVLIPTIKTGRFNKVINSDYDEDYTVSSSESLSETNGSETNVKKEKD